MTTALQVLEVWNPHELLVPEDSDKDTRSRMGRFWEWLTEAGERWYVPDLAAYRDWLLDAGLAPVSVRAYLATVRGRYQQLLHDNALRQRLYDATPADAGAADRKSFVDEVLKRLENALRPEAAPVRVVKIQDLPDGDHIRLTKAQADALMRAPGVDSLDGLRDTALIALMLCTGIREQEAVSLEVRDLRQRLGDELALHVRDGKGAKARLVPYGELSWVLAIVDRWLEAAGISDGRIFWSFWKGGTLRGPLTRRTVQRIVGGYSVAIEGELVTVRPHDLRRTYARRLYEGGVDLVAIQQNLGHASLQTTLGYIGELDGAARRAPAVYSFDLASLETRAILV